MFKSYALQVKTFVQSFLLQPGHRAFMADKSLVYRHELGKAIIQMNRNIRMAKANKDGYEGNPERITFDVNGRTITLFGGATISTVRVFDPEQIDRPFALKNIQTLQYGE